MIRSGEEREGGVLTSHNVHYSESTKLVVREEMKGRTAGRQKKGRKEYLGLRVL